MLSNSTNFKEQNNSNSKYPMVDAFEFALNITAIIPCIAIIIIYLILKKELKYPHFFKLELIFILLVIILLDFISIKLDENRTIDLVKSYFEIVLSLFLLSFTFLCFSLSKTKNKDSNKFLVIALSLGSFILPIYRFIFRIIAHNNYIYLIINVCVISCIYLLDLIFYILIIVNMCSIKKKDEDNKKYHNKNIKRMTLNFMSHLFLCSVLLYSFYKRYKIIEKKEKNFGRINDLLDLLICLSYNFISYVCFLEGKTTDFLKAKFGAWFSFENSKANDNEDEEESESDDDDDSDDDIKIYNEMEETDSSYE